MTDYALLEKVKAKDKEAFRILFNLYSRKVYNTCYMILKDKPSAEDAVQECFIQVYSSIGSLKDLEAFESWLYRITVNCCIKLIRKAAKSPSLSIDDENNIGIKMSGKSITPESYVVNRETSNELLKHIYSLPTYQRIPIILYYYSELSIKEIAKIMACSEGTIKSRLFQSKKNLKNMLSNSLPFENIDDIEVILGEYR